MKKYPFLFTFSILFLLVSLSAFKLFHVTQIKQKLEGDKVQLLAPHIQIENNTSNSIIYFTLAYYDGSGNLIATHSGIGVSSGSSVSDNFPTNAQTVDVSLSVAVKTLEMYGIGCYSSYPSTTITSGSFDISSLPSLPILSASDSPCQ